MSLQQLHACGMAIVGIIGIIKAMRLRKKTRDPAKRHLTSIPGDQPPLDLRPPEAGVLMAMQVRKIHLVSALCDLAQRGYLNIEVSTEEGRSRKPALKRLLFAPTDKGKLFLVSKDSDLEKYERNLLESLSKQPLDLNKLRALPDPGIMDMRFAGFDVIKDRIVSKGLVDPEGFERKGGTLNILGIALIVFFFLEVFAISYLNIVVEWSASVLVTLFPSLVFLFTYAKGPRTSHGVEVCQQADFFITNRIRNLRRKSVSDPFSALRQINRLVPWVMMNRHFASLVRMTYTNARSSNEADSHPEDILPDYVRVTGLSNLHNQASWLRFWIWAETLQSMARASGDMGALNIYP